MRPSFLSSGRRPSRRSLAIVALLLAAVATPTRAREPARTPLESLCDIPPALEGSRAHFLVKYTVGSMSEIRGVDVLYAVVEPEQNRAGFISAAAKCVRDWGFGLINPNKIEPDDPNFAALHFFGPVPEGSQRAILPDGRELPLAWFDELHGEKMKLAQTLLWGSAHGPTPGASYGEFEGEGWTLRTDLKDPEDVRAVRQGVEFSASAFYAAFPEAPAISKEAPLSVVFFEDRLEFAQVVAFDNLININPNLAGRYTSWDRMIYSFKGDIPRAMMARVLAHEATHHFIAQSFYGDNEAPPLWVTEGIASFIESLEFPNEAGFDLSALDRGKFLRPPRLWVKPADEYLETLAAASGGKLPRLRHLVDGRLDKQFLSADPEMAYGLSWLLVHYLINADDGRHRSVFVSWLKGRSAEKGSKEFESATGISLARIDKALPAYIESLRETAPPGASESPPTPGP